VTGLFSRDMVSSPFRSPCPFRRTWREKDRWKIAELEACAESVFSVFRREAARLMNREVSYTDFATGSATTANTTNPIVPEELTGLRGRPVGRPARGLRAPPAGERASPGSHQPSLHGIAPLPTGDRCLPTAPLTFPTGGRGLPTAPLTFPTGVMGCPCMGSHPSYGGSESFLRHFRPFLRHLRPPHAEFQLQRERKAAPWARPAAHGKNSRREGHPAPSRDCFVIA